MPSRITGVRQFEYSDEAARATVGAVQRLAPAQAIFEVRMAALIAHHKGLTEAGEAVSPNPDLNLRPYATGETVEWEGVTHELSELGFYAPHRSVSLSSLVWGDQTFCELSCSGDNTIEMLGFRYPPEALNELIARGTVLNGLKLAVEKGLAEFEDRDES